MPATRGFQGRVLSVEETTPGTTPTDPSYIKFSDHVQSVEVSFNPNAEGFRDIGDYNVQTFVDGLHEYGVKVTYLLQEDRTEQLFDAIERQADGTLKSYSVEVSVGMDGSNPGYFTFTGAKPDEVNVTSEVGSPVEVEVTYVALDVDPVSSEPTVGTGSRESAALADIARFGTSEVQRGGSDVAFITRSAEISVSHNLEVEGDAGQDKPKEIFEGARDVTGTIDISVDDGGVALFTSTQSGTESDLVLNFGEDTGDPEVTIADARWDDFELPLNVEDGFIKRGVPFTAKDATTGTQA